MQPVFIYEAGTNAIGQLTALTDQAGTGSYSYDILGRLATETRVINGVSKSMSYTYNLDSSLRSLTYPSGAVVTYTPDTAGRTLSAVDSGNAINYVTGATYGPDSSLTSYANGIAITNSFTYNKRLQPLAMSAASLSQTVFSIGYDFHVGAGDNGNVFGIMNYKDQSRNQTFTYDVLNRLTSAQNAGTNCAATTVNGKSEYWGNTYGYDAWGNLLAKTVTKCSAENLSVTALANNQLSGYSYDAAGNMTHDLTSGLTYNFDQENRLTGAGSYSYTYDADGNRVKKSNGTTGMLYWYMTPGIVAESDLTGTLKSEYIFFQGDRVARKDFPGNTVAYYFSDHLKTASVVTDSAGTIKSESDYYPWGGELQLTANDSNHYKLGGHERDSETGCDYFGARYYCNGFSRFLSPDWSAVPKAVPYADFGNPQTLNLYQFVGGNPASEADPDGHAFGLDDLVGAVTGAVVGVTVEIVKDVATGQKITAGGVISAGVGGAVFGEGVVNAPETGGLSIIAAGAAKGAIEGAVLNGVQQGVDMATGTQKGFNGKSMAVSVAVGAASGGVASKMPQVKVPGVSSGKGNMKAVAQAVKTKIENGSASAMSLKTAVRGAIGGQVANAGKTATEAASDAAGKKACGEKCE